MLSIGTPACTTRGFGLAEFNKVADLMGDVFDGLVLNPENNQIAERMVKQEVLALCQQFPIYPII